MKSKYIHLLIGNIIAIVAIRELHEYLFIDWCLDQGGIIDINSHTCIKNKEQITKLFTPIIGMFYLMIGTFITVIFSKASILIFSKLKKHGE